MTVWVLMSWDGEPSVEGVYASEEAAKASIEARMQQDLEWDPDEDVEELRDYYETFYHIEAWEVLS